MTDPDEITWPDDALEPPVIGDRLYDETMTVEGMETGGLYWEGSDRTQWYLAGSNAPGDVHLPAAREAEEPPWFTDDDWALPPWVDVRRTVTAMVQDIFGDLGLPPEPSARRVTLDDVAGIFGPDWTGGMDSVAWVRAQRDDNDDPAVPPTVLFTHRHLEPDETMSAGALKEDLTRD